MGRKIKKLLVANRGEIASRIFRTCELMGIEGVALTTPQEPCPVHAEGRELKQVESYLSIEQVIQAAKDSQAEAIHPGYGFLSESPEFSRQCREQGIVFIGPGPEEMEALGDKAKAREVAKQLNIPVAEGTGPFENTKEIEEAIKKIGLPVMLKAAAGGGGKGMKRIESFHNLQDTIETSQRETFSAFGDQRIIVEKYVYPARHVEVQVFGDGKNAIALGERECSLQRRHQKIIEESPCVAIDENTRNKLFDASKSLIEAVGYKNAGTCEFLLDKNGGFYFLEVNARLQVEHPVTEMCTGLDLVKMQIEIAEGRDLPQQSSIVRTGHAIELRLCAEDPWKDFMPSAGTVLKTRLPKETGIPNTVLRIDSGIGKQVSSQFDSLLAKIICHADTREQARQALISTLKNTVVLGVETNQAFLLHLLEMEEFKTSKTFTTTIDEMQFPKRPLPDVLVLTAGAIARGATMVNRNEFDVKQGWKLK